MVPIDARSLCESDYFIFILRPERVYRIVDKKKEKKPFSVGLPKITVLVYFFVVRYLQCFENITTFRNGRMHFGGSGSSAQEEHVNRPRKFHTKNQ
jgi:hypothetical protein